VLLTKRDLLPLLDDFDPTRAESALRALASRAPFLAISAKTGEGFAAWLDWLRKERIEGLSSTASASPPSVLSPES